ncbi:signal transduction histidine kinase [Nesterenkonia xinjiangensis]|uniref:histidine kinase n=2 Tax=Nesterenkonia xinjiangensis TaxID=225327 RepID=A0A7Z0K8X6_9MICC|nr:signal transduction histidine kinase [Nesterenkonia xinjiangensis]
MTTMQPLHVRLWQTLGRRPWILDGGLIALPLALFAVLTAVGAEGRTLFGGQGPWLLVLSLDLMTTLPLAARRSRPAWAAGLIALGALGQVLTLTGPGYTALTVPIVLYSVAKFGTRRASRLYLIVALIGAVLLGGQVFVQQMIFLGGPPVDPMTFVLVLLLTGFSAAVVLVAWLLGDLGGRRRREIAAITERNELLELEREHETRLAADAERMRIAREMHDVISHSMSVMIAQADGGRYVVAQDPQRAGEAFETIGRTGREALTEMRSMLGVLREERESLLLRPSPGLEDLGRMIADVRAAGLPVELNDRVAETLGRPPALPEGAGLAVHRIVQEALTNTLKHGGPEASATVALQAEDGWLIVAVRDTGRGSRAETDGAGSGLLGMAERARLHGGTVEATAHTRGFDVVARLPLTDHDE